MTPPTSLIPDDPALFHLTGEADIGSVQRILEQARAVTVRGGEVSIVCDDSTWFDLGALQLLGELRDELRNSPLEFDSPQQAHVIKGWLTLIANH